MFAISVICAISQIDKKKTDLEFKLHVSGKISEIGVWCFITVTLHKIPSDV